jgi:anaerobic selenocysteine-containing dehydrogenase
VAILCRLARTLFGPEHPVEWETFEHDYDVIREHIAAVVPGCSDYNAKVRTPDGFQLPHPPRDSRTFPTATGRANLTVNELWFPEVPEGRLLLQTLRSHDQYNTTIYGLDDRYRGVKDGRRVVFAHEDDIRAAGLSEGDRVDIVSEWPQESGQVRERRVKQFRVIAYPIARGCVATYFPEANPLVPLESVAEKSNTPTSKSVIVRLERV